MVASKPAIAASWPAENTNDHFRCSTRSVAIVSTSSLQSLRSVSSISIKPKVPSSPIRARSAGGTRVGAMAAFLSDLMDDDAIVSTTCQAPDDGADLSRACATLSGSMLRDRDVLHVF